MDCHVVNLHTPVYLRFRVLFQWFLTALSVRPGRSLEMTATGGKKRRFNNLIYKEATE
jgi:hypothetical protein